MKAIRNTLTVIAVFGAAAIATAANAAQPNGRDSVYIAGDTVVRNTATVTAEQPAGRAGGLALSTKLKVNRSGGNIADVVSRFGRA